MTLRRARSALPAVGVLLAVVPIASTSASAGTPTRFATVASLVAPAALRAAPNGHVLARLATRTQPGSPTVLAVLRRRGRWLNVLSSALGNGRTGWIDARHAALARDPWSIEVSLSRRLLLLRHEGGIYRRMPVGVGRPGSPTPPGLYAVTDRLRAASGAGYGCCVLALTGHQPRLPRGWSGGDRLAIHGTSDPSTIGRLATLGCLRVGERDLRLLMSRVPLGTPVRVRA